ncbi:hypothetical protein L596_019582 [Steinernema carpocapsae]|uniref:Uncharacterized protein n=1 Tax=Steinernema carpocapsae TaxID=34508 RepID=A0A4U5MQY2_STECR|nr:hypothetical protein L596_019582 [Steinernema carpocapsae]
MLTSIWKSIRDWFRLVVENAKKRWDEIANFTVTVKTSMEVQGEEDFPPGSANENRRSTKVARDHPPSGIVDGKRESVVTARLEVDPKKKTYVEKREPFFDSKPKKTSKEDGEVILKNVLC